MGKFISTLHFHHLRNFHIRKLVLCAWFLGCAVLVTAQKAPHLPMLAAQEAITRATAFMPIRSDSALFYADAALQLAELELNDTLIGEALLLRGEAFYKQNRMREAIRDFSRRQRTALQRAEHLPQAQSWQWLGEIYLSVDSLRDALNAFDEAFVQWQAIGDQVQKATVRLRKGKVLERLQNLPEARNAYIDALKIARRAFAQHETGLAHQALGFLYIETEEYELARQHLRIGLMDFAKGSDDQERALCLRGLATIGVAEKKFRIAYDDAQKGLFLAQETGSRSLTMEFYQVLGDIMTGLGNFEKATDYYRLNALVRDSLTGAVGARELSEVVLQYEKEKAELGKQKAIQENALQNAQLALRDASMKRQQTWLYIFVAGMALALIFGGVLAYAFMQKNRANRRLEQALADLNTAQDQLVRSEKLASLGQVTAGIAHEIRNPLNFVNNLSALSVGMIDELAEEIAAIEGKPLGPQQANLLKEYFEDIRSNAQKVMEHGQRASRIVRDMLQHSALEEGEKTAFDINELAEEYLKVAFHSQPALQKGGGNANCDLVIALDPLAGKIVGLRPEIGRALLNIMVNAFEAVDLKRESGVADYQPQVSLRTERVAGGVRITLQDNGPGIAHVDVQKVFDPFFTTKPPAKGTGLGLSLAHESIVRKHKGKIEVQSKPATGTVFTIFLPG